MQRQTVAVHEDARDLNVGVRNGGHGGVVHVPQQPVGHGTAVALLHQQEVQGDLIRFEIRVGVGVRVMGLDAGYECTGRPGEDEGYAN